MMASTHPARIRNVVTAALRVASPRARYLRAPSTSLDDVLHAYLTADRYTGNHSVRVANISLALAAHMGYQNKPFLIELYTGALLHDIGKVKLQKGLLEKPGSLTCEERSLVEVHPCAGVEMLGEILPSETILSIVRSHHERFDGDGYPHKLHGTAIPLGARIVSLADAFDAMLSIRPYRAALSLDTARAILRADNNRQWDARLAYALCALSEGGFTGLEERAAQIETLSAPQAPVSTLSY